MEKNSLKEEKKHFDHVTARLIGIFVCVFVIMSIALPGRFLTSRNLFSMLFQFPELGLITLSIAITMMTRGVDISTVTVANLLATVSAMVILKNVPPGAPTSIAVGYILLSFVITLVIACMCGAANGFLIGMLGVPPILGTLGTSSIFTGISMVLTKGQGIFGVFPDELRFLGSGRLFGYVPVPLLMFLVMIFLVYIIVHKTPFGLQIQWVGSNRNVVFFAGIDVPWVLIKTYVCSSLIAAVTGMLILARTNSAKPDYGLTYVLQAILASVLAGISPLGGKGRISNLILAIFTLQCLDSGFNFLRITSFMRSFTYGLLLILGIFVELVIEKYRQRRMVLKALKVQ